LKKIFSALICFAALQATAQLRQLTLNEAIATSLQNNYNILLAQTDASLAALDRSYADFAFLPTLNGSAGVLWNVNNQKQVLADGSKRERPDIKSNAITSSLNLNWTLFDGLRMFINRDRLGQLEELGELQIKSQVINTVAQVMQLYYDVVRQQQQLAALEEQMRLSEERLKLAQYKFDVGTGAKPDLLQAQIDLNGQRSAALTQQTAIIKIKEQLNLLLVQPLETDFLVADTTIEYNDTLTLDAVRTGVTATNPELLIAQKNIDLANLDLRIRRAERLPTVQFNSAYNFNRSNNVTVINPFQPLFNRLHGFNYGFSASVPIFNAFNNRRLTKAAEINVRAQQLLLDQSRITINTSVVNAWRDYDLSKRTLKLEEDNMLLVRENLFIARERYRLGITTFIELREAQQSLSDAAFRLIQARYNTKVAEIELMRLRGELVR
jgi:outer membrane protein TolC